MFKKILCAISLYLSSGHAVSGSLSTPPTAIPGSSIAGSNNTFSCYNSQMNQTLFSWTDEDSGNPYYAIYDDASGTFTTSPTPITNTQSHSDVYCCYNAQTNQVFFSWQQLTTNFPYYAIYNCSSKNFTTSGTTISNSLEVSFNVYSCYNSQNNQIVFSWSGYTDNIPHYAIYNCSNQTIGNPSQISNTSMARHNVELPL